MPNVDGYVDLGASFSRTWSLCGNDGRPSAFREQAYPVFLGLLFRIFGQSYAALLIAHCFLGVGMLALIFLLGRDLYGEDTGLAALAVGTFYPPFVYYTAQPLRETFLGFTSTLALWLLVRARRRNSSRSYAAAGAAEAAAVLTKSTLLPFGLVLAPFGLWFVERDRPGKKGRFFAAYLAVFIGIFGLWPLRNQLVLGVPI